MSHESRGTKRRNPVAKALQLPQLRRRIQYNKKGRRPYKREEQDDILPILIDYNEDDYYEDDE